MFLNFIFKYLYENWKGLIISKIYVQRDFKINLTLKGHGTLHNPSFKLEKIEKF